MARSAVFLVRLSKPSTATVTITYATEDATAVGGSDYTPTFGTMTFQPGQTVMQVIVPVRDDKPGVSQEQFRLKLSNPVNAVLKSDRAVCTLPGTPVNSQPALRIDNVTVASAT